MATDIEIVQEKVTAARRDVERIAAQSTGLDDTEHLRLMLRAAANALVLSELLLAEARSAEKFWQVRTQHGMT